MSRAKGFAISPLIFSFALIAWTYGCASETGSEMTEAQDELRIAANLGLEAPKDGIQVETTGTVVEAGDDAEWCEVVQLPGASDRTYEVARIDSAMTPYAHYLLVSAAVPGSETEANMEVGTRVSCQRAGEVYGNELIDLFASQTPRDVIQYPNGVGAILHGGQKIVVDYQYFNTSEEPITAKVKINFHVTVKGTIKKTARVAMFNNLTIYTPPHGESSHLGECVVDQDVAVTAVARHTHQWGSSFKVWFAGGKRDGELIWSSTSQNEEPRYRFLADPIYLRAGEGLRFQCDYRNTTSEPLQFGAKVNDEVCLLAASLWASDPGDEIDEQGCLLFTVDEDGVARK